MFFEAKNLFLKIYYGRVVLPASKNVKILLFLTIIYVQVVWVGTCAAAILLGLDLGLAAGLGVELLSVVLRAQL